MAYVTPSWDTTNSTGFSFSTTLATKTASAGWNNGTALSSDSVQPSATTRKIKFKPSANEMIAGFGKTPHDSQTYYYQDIEYSAHVGLASNDTSYCWIRNNATTVATITGLSVDTDTEIELTMDTTAVKVYIDGSLKHTFSQVPSSSDTYFLQAVPHSNGSAAHFYTDFGTSGGGGDSSSSSSSEGSSFNPEILQILNIGSSR